MPTATTCTINGIQPVDNDGGRPQDGRVLILYLPPEAPISSVSITHENASATAVHRINTVGGGSKTLVKSAGAGFCARMLVYDDAQGRWVMMG
jgi:hypothetical protein